MKKLILAISLSTLLLAACQKSAEAPKPAPAPAPMVEAPPPEAAVGQSCSMDCGKQAKAEIVCAAGETPECACAPVRARCLPAARP